VTVDFPAEATRALYAEVHRVVEAVVELGGAVGWLHVPDETETAEFLDAQLALARAGDGAIGVVRVEAVGPVEALGIWQRYQAPVLRQNAEIRKVMVHPDARGRGLGRILTEALTEHATAAGIEVLVLDARGNNHAAHALYESLGWVRCGTIPEFIAVGEHRWDRVLFSRRVNTPPDILLHGSEPVGPGASTRREDPDQT
jgi:ribosomal protein S18 acetylase RimI-like enzyme